MGMEYQISMGLAKSEGVHPALPLADLECVRDNRAVARWTCSVNSSLALRLTLLMALVLAPQTSMKRLQYPATKDGVRWLVDSLNWKLDVL